MFSFFISNPFAETAVGAAVLQGAVAALLRGANRLCLCLLSPATAASAAATAEALAARLHVALSYQHLLLGEANADAEFLACLVWHLLRCVNLAPGALRQAAHLWLRAVVARKAAALEAIVSPPRKDGGSGGGSNGGGDAAPGATVLATAPPPTGDGGSSSGEVDVVALRMLVDEAASRAYVARDTAEARALAAVFARVDRRLARRDPAAGSVPAKVVFFGCSVLVVGRVCQPMPGPGRRHPVARRQERSGGV